MRTLLILLCLFIFNTVNSQVYTRGEYAQLYWDWRPDISSSTYEFTFINYISTRANFPQAFFAASINLFYWDDCNYGKNYIDYDPLTGIYAHEPLRDTLFRQTTHFGILDTLCGFSLPNTLISFPQASSPKRTRVVYKGLIELPEKCNSWHFSLGTTDDFDCVCIRSHLYTNGSNIYMSVTYNNQKSNIDSFYCSNSENCTMLHSIRWIWGIYGCSFNTIDHPDNSSVRFLSPPIYTYQTQKAVEFNPGPFDPDHDSIVVTIPDTLRGINNFVAGSLYMQLFLKNDIFGNYHPEIFTNNSYYAPLPGQIGPNPIRFNSENNPFDTDSTFHLVDSTGRTTFTAQSEMEPVLYYSAKDYRNGKFVSESYCTNQFTLLADGRLPSHIQIDTAGLQNASFNTQGTMVGCPGWPISFDAYIKLPGGPSGNLVVRTTADTTLPGNGICTITNMNTDSVHLTLNWTAPPNAHGLYNVFVYAKDSNCTPPYHQYLQVYTWSFYIDSCSLVMSVDPELSRGEGDLKVYPNPVSKNVTISGSEPFKSVKIYNLLSELVIEKNVSATKMLDVNVSGLPAGVYMVNVDGKWVRKMVVAEN